MDIFHIRNRMIKIKPIATCTVTLKDSDEVCFGWDWREQDSDGSVMNRHHEFSIDINVVTMNSRTFEHAMHKATRVIRHGRVRDGQ
jgi:hypothetical protein